MRFIVALLALLASTAAMAEPQRQTFKDANGRTLGRSLTDSRGNTTFYDSFGRNTGRSTTNGNTTTIYDSFGRRTGTSKGASDDHALGRLALKAANNPKDSLRRKRFLSLVSAL